MHNYMYARFGCMEVSINHASVDMTPSSRVTIHGGLAAPLLVGWSRS